MKNLFPGFYPYTKNQIKHFFDDATIVFDASILLDIFRISEGLSFIEFVATKIPIKRLWIPYDVAWLYHNRLVSVIDEQIEEDNNVSKHLTALGESMHNTHGHPFLPDELVNRCDELIREIEDVLEQDRCSLTNCLKDHKLKKDIEDLFHDRVGTEYDKTKTLQIYDESQKRFDTHIPPCVTDKGNLNPRLKHNRYVTWKQIQNYASSYKKPILLITNRITPDWFFIYKDTIVTPHQSLINEFKQETGQDVYIMSAHAFLEHLCPKEKRNGAIEKLLSQLHVAPVLGRNQQTTLFTGNTDVI